jgi:hypothetical protein
MVELQHQRLMVLAEQLQLDSLIGAAPRCRNRRWIRMELHGLPGAPVT